MDTDVRSRIITYLTNNCSMTTEQAERAYDFAYREYHAYGWGDIFNGLSDIVFVITGWYPDFYHLDPEQN
jgi:hypothetical protein